MKRRNKGRDWAEGASTSVIEVVNKHGIERRQALTRKSITMESSDGELDR